MSDSLGFTLAVVLGDLVPAAIGLYAAYWAFSIRRALAGRVYRNHALWLGVVCIVWEVGLPINNISSSSMIVNLALNLSLFAELAFVFAFVDSTVRVARRSDPLLRRILHWDKVRFVLWGDLALAAVYLVAAVVYPSSENSGLGGAIGFPLFLLPFIAGAPVVLIGARRSKDRVLRGSLKWFGVLLLSFLFNALLSFIEMFVFNVSQYDASFSYPALAFAPAAILGAYALYRSARSLAPMNRLSAEGAKTAAGTTR
ncbi:MAG: hypothetical protein OK449_06840 [Thaumarchaeota archaeon]|nr:hypothetical protein [Nitrososphaerota archaeon]